MGADLPKQYLELAGVPIIARTVEVFEAHPLIDVIVVTVPAGDEARCRDLLLGQFNLKKVRDVVAGGETRQQSVFNGLQALADTDLVAVHDAVRPLVAAATISRTIEAAQSTGAALACVAVQETVKRQVGNLLETIDRTDLWLAHTPQTFRTSLILEAHLTALTDGITGTDDASLVERLGHPVAVVQDMPGNLKITTLEDLELAEFLLRCRMQSGRA